MNFFKSDLDLAPKLFCYYVILVSLLRYIIHFKEHMGNNLRLMFIYFLVWIVVSVPFIMVIKMKKLGFYILAVFSLFIFFSGAFGDEFIYKTFGIEAATIILFALLQIGGENSSWKRMV